MFKTILVPTDGSPLSEKAVNAAVQFAKENGSKIVGISVAEPYPLMPLPEVGGGVDSSALYNARMRDLAQQYVRIIEESARAQGVQCETVIAESFTPHEEIIEAAQKHNCDVIFMASHGRKGLSRLFVGSETQKVLADSKLPVVVFR